MIKNYLDRMQSLPTLPHAVSRLYALLQDQETSASDFEKVIKPDAALTGNLLRMANSSYFGLPRRVTGIRQAITLMGLKRVFEAATSASFIRLIPPRLSGYDISASGFWLHSCAVAIIGERLAKVFAHRTPDLIFTAGLLHDMGKLVLCLFIDDPDAIRSGVRDRQLSLVAAERLVTGTDHAELGAELGAKWNLPGQVIETARWHHNPMGIENEVDHTLVDLVHIANALAHMMGYGTDSGELARPADEAVIERVGVSVQQLEQVASDTVEQIQEMSQLFNAAAGGAQ